MEKLSSCLQQALSRATRPARYFPHFGSTPNAKSTDVQLGNCGFVVHLPHRKSFSPDVAFVRSMDFGMKFYEGAPEFAVEVRSEGDYGPRAEREIAAKRADYFAAGTLVVWDVDLLSENVIRVYRATHPKEAAIY